MAKRKVGVVALKNFGPHRVDDLIEIDPNNEHDAKALALWEERGWVERISKAVRRPKRDKAVTSTTDK